MLLRVAAIDKVCKAVRTYARVIAGKLRGAKGPAKTFTALNVFDANPFRKVL